MMLQRYDIRDPNGQFVERHWRPVNTPLYDQQGRLTYLLHHVEDVTAQILLEKPASIRDDNSEPEALVATAFDRSWRFVEKDPFLVHHPKALLRERLLTYLEISTNAGERDLFRLANNAISKLREELGSR